METHKWTQGLCKFILFTSYLFWGCIECSVHLFGVALSAVMAGDKIGILECIWILCFLLGNFSLSRTFPSTLLTIYTVLCIPAHYQCIFSLASFVHKIEREFNCFSFILFQF